MESAKELSLFNPLITINDQSRFSLHNAIPDTQVTRILNDVNYEIISWSNPNSPNHHHNNCMTDRKEK